MVEQVILIGGSGQSADRVAKSMLANVLNEKEPFHAIELRELNHLLVMMQGADKPHVFGQNSCFYVTAHYSFTPEYPIGRSYFVKTNDLFKLAKIYKFFSDNNIQLPIIPPAGLNELINEKGSAERIRAFLAKKRKQLAPFKGLFDGRKKSTTTQNAIYLNSPGCLKCGEITYAMMTSTFTGSEGVIIGFNVCQAHMDEAEEDKSLIDYLAKIFKQTSPFPIEYLDPVSHFKVVESWLPEALNAKIDKIKNNTITVIRESKFKVILRLDAPGDYAYVIKNPVDIEVARFDSANHHDVAYGPDHIHPYLPKNKSVYSSFTTGSPLVDIKAILNMLEKKEREFKQSHNL